MLSSLTLYLEYHNAMMEAGVFPALIKAILDARMVPQVSPKCQMDCKDVLQWCFTWHRFPCSMRMAELKMVL